MSYVNKVYKDRPHNDIAFEDEDWADLVSPSERGHGRPDCKPGTKDHRELTHRDAPNQHPISAIEGLVEAVNSKIPEGSVSVEETSEGLALTIGQTTVLLYGTGTIRQILINGVPLPVDQLGNVNITELPGVDVSNSLITIEDPQSTTTVTVEELATRILEQIATIESKIEELEETKIIFRTWPGLQGD